MISDRKVIPFRGMPGSVASENGPVRRCRSDGARFFCFVRSTNISLLAELRAGPFLDRNSPSCHESKLSCVLEIEIDPPVSN